MDDADGLQLNVAHLIASQPPCRTAEQLTVCTDRMRLRLRLFDEQYLYLWKVRYVTASFDHAVSLYLYTLLTHLIVNFPQFPWQKIFPSSLFNACNHKTASVLYPHAVPSIDRAAVTATELLRGRKTGTILLNAPPFHAPAAYWNPRVATVRWRLVTWSVAERKLAAVTPTNDYLLSSEEGGRDCRLYNFQFVHGGPKILTRTLSFGIILCSFFI